MLRRKMLLTGESINVVVSRKQFVLGGVALVGAAVLSRSALHGNNDNGPAHGDHWYEVVQDMNRPATWHINLFAGSNRGDLARSVLVERKTEQAADAEAIKKGLEYPWRIQQLDGHQEQSF